MVYKKLNEDDILEIITEYYQELEGCSVAKACMLGESKKDLRAIIALGNENENLSDCDLTEIDKTESFNGEHSFLEEHHEWWL